MTDYIREGYSVEDLDAPTEDEAKQEEIDDMIQEQEMCDYGLDRCVDIHKRDVENCLGCWVIAPPKVNDE